MSSSASSRASTSSRASGFRSSPKLPGVRSVSAMGQIEGTSKKKLDKDRSMQNIVQIYKQYVRPEQKGLTVSDFRKMFDSREGPMRKQVDRRVAHYFPQGWSAEICEDMFRVLDKDKDGYVLLNDFLRFYAPKQLNKIPKWTYMKKNNKKIISTVLDKLPTPHLPEIDQRELQEVFHLWVADADSDSGTLTRDEVMEVLAGRKGAVFNWLEAREAADRMFEGIPYETITFAEFANHLQGVMTVPYNHLMAGEVKKFKQHRRPRDAVERACDKLKTKGFALKRAGGDRSATGSSNPSTGLGERGETDGLGKGGRLEPLSVSFDMRDDGTSLDSKVPAAPRPFGAAPPARAASMRITRREQVAGDDDGFKEHVQEERGGGGGRSAPLDRQASGTNSLRRQPSSGGLRGGATAPIAEALRINRAQTLATMVNLDELPGRELDLTPLPEGLDGIGTPSP